LRGANGKTFVSSSVDGAVSARSGPFARARVHAQISEHHDEECLGLRRSDKGCISFPARLALSEAGHSVQIFLLGEAVSLMRKSVAAAVVPVGWPPLEQTLAKWFNGTLQITPAAPAAAPGRLRKAIWTVGSEVR